MLKKILAPLFVILIILGWYNTIQGIGSEEKNFRQHMEKAQQYESKEIYIDALAEYELAMEYTRDVYPVKMKILDIYLSLDKYSDFIDYAEEMLEEYDYPEDLVSKVMDYCMENQRETYALSLLKKAIKREPQNQKYAQLLVDLRGTYQERFIGKELLGTSYNGYYVYSDKDKLGLLNSKGEATFHAQYDVIMPYGKNPEYAPVKKDGQWYYIDKEGYKKLVPDAKVDSLGMFGDGLAIFSQGGLYGYADKDFIVKAEPIWQNATAFANQTALVCKDGKWALINPEFELMSDYIFDDVVMDGFGFATSESVFIAKKDDFYAVYDLKGNRLGNAQFDKAKAFVSTEPAAVMSNRQWGFVGKDGEWKIDPAYKDADSFSNELAPVLIDNQWGYIDIDNAVRIKPGFEFAMSFSKEGYAPVKTTSWKFIELIK